MVDFSVEKAATEAILMENVIFFDYCDQDTWCQDVVDYILKELGYTASWLEHVYWLEQGYGMSDGLRNMDHEQDARKMVAAVYCKEMRLFVDHVDLLGSEQDDVCGTIIPELPKVILSPMKKKMRRTGTEGKEEEESEAAVEAENADSEINDSDYDFSEGEEEYDTEEDDLDYAKHVDDDVHDAKGKMVDNKVWPDDAVLEDDYLQPICTEDDLLSSFKPRVFNPEADMENPIFKLAMTFSTMSELRKALSQYSMKNRVQVQKKRNNSKSLEAHCADDCPWKLVASYDNRTDMILVKEYVPDHLCEKVHDVKEMTYKYLCDKYIEVFRDNESVTVKSFEKIVQRELNMEPSRFKLAKAKYAALKVIHGDEKVQYNQLWDYGEELRFQNPGTFFYVRTIGNPGVFSTCYFSLDACKRGFLKGCRPIICLDGTHIKNKYGGQLLTAVSIDGNDGIFPIAMAVVEVECYSSWKWFLTTLKNDLNVINTAPFTIMSDKQKVPTRAATHLQEELPESSFVARHREEIPPPGRRTTALQVWRDTATGQAAAAAARGRAKGGRGRHVSRGRGRGIGRGLGRKRGSKWLLFGDEGPSMQPLAQVPPEPEEYQSAEINYSQTAPDYLSD